MHSFITNTPITELDNFRREVRGKINHKIDTSK